MLGIIISLGEGFGVKLRSLKFCAVLKHELCSNGAWDSSPACLDLELSGPPVLHLEIEDSYPVSALQIIVRHKCSNVWHSQYKVRFMPPT